MTTDYRRSAAEGPRPGAGAGMGGQRAPGNVRWVATSGLPPTANNPIDGKPRAANRHPWPHDARPTAGAWDRFIERGRNALVAAPAIAAADNAAVPVAARMM